MAKLRNTNLTTPKLGDPQIEGADLMRILEEKNPPKSASIWGFFFPVMHYKLHFKQKRVNTGNQTKKHGKRWHNIKQEHARAAIVHVYVRVWSYVYVRACFLFCFVLLFVFVFVFCFCFLFFLFFLFFGFRFLFFVIFFLFIFIIIFK